MSSADCAVDLSALTDPRGYSWAEVLRLPMRRVVDLYLDLPEVDGEGLAELARARLDEIRAPARDRPSYDSYDLTSRAEPTLTWERPYADAELEIWLASIHSWKISLPQGPLSSVSSAAYAGCLDLLGDGVADDMRVTPSVGSLRQTRFPGQVPPIAMDWPMPAHSTFWGYERLVRWLKVADNAWIEPARSIVRVVGRRQFGAGSRGGGPVAALARPGRSRAHELGVTVRRAQRSSGPGLGPLCSSRSTCSALARWG